MSEPGTVIRLRVPKETLNNRKLAEASVVIDKDGWVIKDQGGPAEREATPDELAQAIDVYG